jgi:hypothetical protein
MGGHEGLDLGWAMAGAVSYCHQIAAWVKITSPRYCAPVAQLDRALASGAKGCGFKSRRAYQLPVTAGPYFSGVYGVFPRRVS